MQKWLTKDEDILNLPMLLIDDEADNASVNTNDPEKDPTAINAAINKILRSFKQASYLGITATPFANIFIDPSISEDGAAKDLFPKDFLTLLPIPDNYIGADKIFGSVKLFRSYANDKECKGLNILYNIIKCDKKEFQHGKSSKASSFSAIIWAISFLFFKI